MKGFIDIVTSFIANPEPTIAVKPRMGSLHHPTVTTELLTGFDSASGDPHFDPALGQRLSTTWIIVALIGMQFVRSFARTTSGTPNGFNRIDHRLEQLGIMHVGSRQLGRQRDALFFNDQVAF